MNKEKGMSNWGRCAARIVFVLMVVWSVVQVYFFILIGDAGVYTNSREEVEKNWMYRAAWSTGRNVLLQYQFYDRETAHDEAAGLYADTNMNFVICRQGRQIDEIVNVTNEKPYAYEFTFEAAELFSEEDLWADAIETTYEGEALYEDAYDTEYNTEYGMVYNEGEYFPVVYTDADGVPFTEYSVICEIAEPVFAGDTVESIHTTVNMAYDIRYQIIGMFAFSFVTALILLVWLMKNAGWVKGCENMQVRWIDRCALDVYLICYLGIVGFIVTMASEFLSAYTIVDRLIVSRYDFFVLALLAIIDSAALISFFTLQMLESISVRLKTGNILKQTWTYRFCRWIKKIILRCVAFVGKNLPFIWKALLIFFGVSFVEFCVILIFYWEPDALLIFWMLEKILFLAFGAVIVVNLRQLQEGGEKLAKGNLEHKIDTGKMFGDLKRHGENLNSIGIGMQNAVDERMKSERFKTELITNVSHDIKTPLTSIINYVDLLEKEDLQNPNAREYLEVLHRQSARLKKLIEDLMEASKASTGALSVNFEDCEVGVMLTQAAGEFEEKLKSKELTLLIQKPGEDLVIRADGRHLWRIFDNLLNNIYKYAQPGTRVYLNLEKRERSLLIIFRNTSRFALNISGEELQERFVRGDSSRNTEGSGLGLSIATSLTELMGGNFELVIDGDLFKVILTFPYCSQ